MSELEHLRIVQFFVSAGLLWFVYSYIYRRTRADRLREDLFTIRDRLFDYMWQHGLSYDLPAYRMMRDFLNGGIRVVDQLSLFHVFVLAYLTRDSRKTLRPNKAIEEIEKIEEPQTRAHFKEVYQQVSFRLAQYVFLEGPHWLAFKPIELLLLRYGAPTIRERLESPAMADELLILGRKDSPEARFLANTVRESCR